MLESGAGKPDQFWISPNLYLCIYMSSINMYIRQEKPQWFGVCHVSMGDRKYNSQIEKIMTSNGEGKIQTIVKNIYKCVSTNICFIGEVRLKRQILKNVLWAFFWEQHVNCIISILHDYWQLKFWHPLTFCYTHAICCMHSIINM